MGLSGKVCRVVGAAAVSAALLVPTLARGEASGGPMLVPQAVAAPDRPEARGDATTPACTAPTADPSGKTKTYAWIHCYTAAQIRAAYGVDALGNTTTGTGLLGSGQTIVLVDSYGSPTAAQDLQFFHDTFFPSLPNPNFDEVYPQGAPDYNNANGNGLSGPNSAAGWTGEATLDIEWAYAIAPLAHIVLLAVPPAETEGVQGFPNLFKAIQWAINTYPAGTVFSQSFGVTEQTFGGAAQGQTAKFDSVYQAAAAKGDTVLASSGDNGSQGVSKQHKDTVVYQYPTDGWPASSPFVTAVGGTQLQYGWTWNPTSDVPFLPSGDYNPDYFNYTTGDTLTEAVWNESWLPAASGGGPSAIYSRPSYQDSVSSVIGTNARGVPDLSWNAAVNGGVLVYITAYPTYQRPGWHVYGGTSAASPQVAGLVALANEQQADNDKKPLGFLNPLLYTVGSGSAFRDIVPITQGTAVSGQLVNNQLFQYNADGSVSPSSIAGYPVLTGWDMTTGFGSPQAAAFVAAITAARNAMP